MKAVILAGGYGTRISEESAIRPKPMVEIGGKPILWHIMKTYGAHGITDFVILEKADRVGVKTMPDGKRVRVFKSNGEMVDAQ